MGGVGEEAGQSPDTFEEGGVVDVEPTVPAPGSVAVTPVCLTGETAGLCGAGVGFVQEPPASDVCVLLLEDGGLVDEGLPELVCVDVVGGFEVEGGVSDSGSSVPSGKSSVSGVSPPGISGGIGSPTGIGTMTGITTRFLLTEAWL